MSHSCVEHNRKLLMLIHHRPTRVGVNVNANANVNVSVNVNVNSISGGGLVAVVRWLGG